MSKFMRRLGSIVVALAGVLASVGTASAGCPEIIRAADTSVVTARAAYNAVHAAALATNATDIRVQALRVGPIADRAMFDANRSLFRSAIVANHAALFAHTEMRDALTAAVDALRVAEQCVQSWVLWSQIWHDRGGAPFVDDHHEWRVHNAEETFAACDASMKTALRMHRDMRRGADPVRVYDGNLITETFTSGVIVKQHLVCIPAGTDPRPRDKR